ncbi:hypothetical protein A2U01_0088288, partial [Trifolium medium]|nr:hypothetical protein [Trifolium medium]
MVKEFYSNLTNPSQKRREVIMRGRSILYSEVNINKYFNIQVEEDMYEATLESLDEDSLTELMQ